MESILVDVKKLESKSNLSRSISEIDSLLSTLHATRTKLASSAANGTCNAAVQTSTLLNLQKAVGQHSKRLLEAQKDVYSGQNKLGKSIDKKFKNVPALENQSIFRMLGIDGAGKTGEDEDGGDGRKVVENGRIEQTARPTVQFSTQTQQRGTYQQLHPIPTPTFSTPLSAPPRQRSSSASSNSLLSPSPLGSSPDIPIPSEQDLINRAIAMHLIREGHFNVSRTLLKEAESAGRPISLPPNLREAFERMYSIRADIANDDFESAIAWAREEENAKELAKRGSRLEWELCRMRFLRLLQNGGENGLKEAVAYSRREFLRFRGVYSQEIQELMTSILYLPPSPSPYTPYPLPTALASSSLTSSLLSSFSKEYCSLLLLSSLPPLLLSTTAGTLSLPIFQKMTLVMKERNTKWNTPQELPVATPLPESYQFHNIFVCPVTKAQCSETNFPVMLPCGHVISVESLNKLPRLGQAGVLKCTYCPKECEEREVRKVTVW